MNILVAGELNVDLVLQNYQSFPALGREVLVEDVSLTLGSASAICAAGLAKLGNAVSYAGKIGRDEWGDRCLNALRSLGIDTRYVIPDDSIKTGITVSVTSPGDRALITYLGSIAAMRAADLEGVGLARFQHLHVSSFFLQQRLRPDIKSLLRQAHGLGLTTSLDPGFDPEEGWGSDLIDALTEVDVFLPNEVELEGITKQSEVAAALRQLDNGRTLTVAKLGSQGCAVLLDGALLRLPAFAVQPVDTTGAGDSFNAGFLHAWLRRQPLPEAMRFAAACGAISTQGSGGTATQATEAEAQQFLTKAGAAA